MQYFAAYFIKGGKHINELNYWQYMEVKLKVNNVILSSVLIHFYTILVVLCNKEK